MERHPPGDWDNREDSRARRMAPGLEALVSEIRALEILEIRTRDSGIRIRSRVLRRLRLRSNNFFATDSRESSRIKPNPEIKTAPSRDEAVFNFSKFRDHLHAERRSAAAGALHVRIFELEARAFEGLDVVDDAAVEIHDRGRVDINFQAVHVEGLVHHSGAIFKLHGIGEAGASAAHHTDAQTGGNGTLLAHDFLHLGDGAAGEAHGRFLHFGIYLRLGYFGNRCGRHSYLLGLKASWIIACTILPGSKSFPGKLCKLPSRLDVTGGQKSHSDFVTAPGGEGI